VESIRSGVSDITYIATLEGWLYLAIILDLFSRKEVGWKLGENQEVRKCFGFRAVTAYN
jgi:putative transposase